jgi:hypothetical protein
MFEKSGSDYSGVLNFEKDNIFIFSKKSWRLLRNTGIRLKYEGVVINNVGDKKIKRKLKNGINLDWSSMKEVLKVKERTVMLDTIDKYRANSIYLGLLKQMMMYQRVVMMETWLLSHEWKNDQILQVKNVHLFGKFIRNRLDKSLCLKSQVVTIPECSNFEKVSSWCEKKIDKAICYLKWKKDKFKLQRNNIIDNTLIENLFDDTMKYGFQVKLNSFLIWIYTVRWNLYAEISLLSSKVMFGCSRSRKKRRRLEVMYSLWYNLVLKNKFKSNKLYLVNQSSLKVILKFIVKRKKRRQKKELVYEENVGQMIEAKVGKN